MNILQNFWQVLLKTAKVMGKRKNLETATVSRLRLDDKMQCGTLGWILEQKKDISGKTGEIQIKTRV